MPSACKQNGAFFSVANLVENGGRGLPGATGPDRNGALYKMYNQSTPLPARPSGQYRAEKKTRKKTKATPDLVALYNGVTQGGQAQVNYVTTTSTCPSTIRHARGPCAGQRRGLLPTRITTCTVILRAPVTGECFLGPDLSVGRKEAGS